MEEKIQILFDQISEFLDQYKPTQQEQTSFLSCYGMLVETQSRLCDILDGTDGGTILPNEKAKTE